MEHLLTELQGLGRLIMAGTDRARDAAIRALDALNDRKSTESADYWVGYLASALEIVIRDLRDGA